MLQEKSELVESSENLKEKIDFIERDQADINNKISCFDNEKERERNSFKSKYDVLHR